MKRSCFYSFAAFEPLRARVILLVPPVSSLLDNQPVLTNKQVPLVTCTAAGSKPPAEVKWNTGELSGILTTPSRTIEHDNGTTTTISSVLGVPTREMRNHSISCVITSASLMEQVTLPFNIQIYCEYKASYIHYLLIQLASLSQIQAETRLEHI